MSWAIGPPSCCCAALDHTISTAIQKTSTLRTMIYKCVEDGAAIVCKLDIAMPTINNAVIYFSARHPKLTVSITSLCSTLIPNMVCFICRTIFHNGTHLYIDHSFAVQTANFMGVIYVSSDSLLWQMWVYHAKSFFTIHIWATQGGFCIFRGTRGVFC